MEKINNKEAISLIVSSSLGIMVLVSSQIISSQCISAGLLNTCYISFLAFFLTFIICKLYKKFIGIGFLDITEFLGGKILRFFIGMIFFIYFLFTASVVLCKAINCLEIVYYPMTHPNYTTLLFIITACIVTNLKNNGFLRAAFVLFPIVLIAIFFIFVGNFPNFDFENIYPLFGNGIKETFLFGTTNLFTFGGIIYMLFIPQNLKRPDKFLSIAITSAIVSSILLTIIVAIIILMFNKNVTSGQLFPLYMSVRSIEFGTFFQRLDSAYLLIMNIAICSFLGIYFNLCTGIIKDITDIEDIKPVNYVFALLLYGCTLGLNSIFEFEFIQNYLFKILFFTVLIIGILILILSNIKKVRED